MFSLSISLKNISVYFSVKDIQGYKLNQSTVDKMIEMGFSSANILLEHSYHNFIGIYNNGSVVYQYIGGDEKSNYAGTINNHVVSIESSTLHYGNSSNIIIDGIDYAVKYRGINIVVVDNLTGKIIDSVAFDTHLKEIPCIR